MARISCPKCGGESVFSVKQEVFEGPFRCAKCRELFKIHVENDELRSCQPLDQQDIDRLNVRKGFQR
ncbi:MAG: hypothetical protein HYX84_06675 [Chloroflexi bacterium]|nr:hypothetical protein [Chloroflexota bacterium]